MNIMSNDTITGSKTNSKNTFLNPVIIQKKLTIGTSNQGTSEASNEITQ